MEESSDKRPFEGFAFPAEFATCITEVISYWAALESNINMAIWHLAGVYPAIGACLTEQIFNLDNRLKALRALLALRKAPTTLIDRINRFSERVRKPQELRNRITHDTWHQSLDDDKGMLQLEIGAKGALTYDFKHITIESLQADRDEVRKAMREAVQIRDAIEDALPTLPEIPLKELHPIVLRSRVQRQTRSIDETFLLFPPKPSRG
jgi:hypothetical protein